MKSKARAISDDIVRQAATSPNPLGRALPGWLVAVMAQSMLGVRGRGGGVVEEVVVGGTLWGGVVEVGRGGWGWGRLWWWWG